MSGAAQSERITEAMAQALLVLDVLSWREPLEDPLAISARTFGRELYGQKRSIARPAAVMFERLRLQKLAQVGSWQGLTRCEITPDGHALAQALRLARTGR